MNEYHENTAAKILDIIFTRRKLLESEALGIKEIPVANLPSVETEPHLKKIKLMIGKSLPIQMILPAYPGKSPNRNKTLGKLPDLAEKHSIDNLNELCVEISEIYQPGATIVICSDGYIFSDLVRIPDQDVFNYTEAIKKYYLEYYPHSFLFFDMKSAFPQLKNLDSIREELMIGYGTSLVELIKKSKHDKETLSMYRGIAKFLYEDFCGLKEFSKTSNNQIQKQSKRVSLRVIQRSNAWSQLLEDVYPNLLRLSIHPQFRVSKKIGVNLANADDCWRTPWHSVAIIRDRKIHLQKRSLIDENTHRLIFNGGKPCHYHEISSSQKPK